MRTTPRILFNVKDHPTLNSGYGIIARYLAPLLAERYGRENVLILAPVYQRDAVGEYEGMKVLPGITPGFGEEILEEHYNRQSCNILLQLGDTWPLGALPDMAAQDRVLWVSWCPVDWLGMPKNIINRIRFAHKLVPFSKAGEAQLRQGGLPNVERAIWLGLNTDLWKPTPRETLPKTMYSLHFRETTFNILLVGANQERKRMRQQLEAIQLFRRTFPQSDPRLYLHTTMKVERDLEADLDELGLADISAWPNQYMMVNGGLPEDAMGAIFNCADVVLNCCQEGFGLAHIQAQACGVPVIYLTEGAGPELVVSGVGVPPMAVETTRNQMTVAIPNTMGIARALEELWKRRVERGQPLRSEKSVQFVQDNFSWPKIAEQWFEVIDRVMEDREKFCYDLPAASQELRDQAARMVEL